MTFVNVDRFYCKVLNNRSWNREGCREMSTSSSEQEEKLVMLNYADALLSILHNLICS